MNQSWFLKVFALWMFVLNSSNGHFQGLPVDRLSGEQIQRDLDSLQSWIRKIHPSPFVHCSEEEFEDAWISAAETFVGGGTLFAEAQMVARVCNALKDSHTGLALQSFSTQLGSTYGHLPLEIRTIQNHLIVTNAGTHVQLVGREVTKLNDVPARSILGSALPLVSQEGDAQIARLRVAEKLWNDIAPFSVGSRLGDSIEVSFEHEAPVMLPVLNNDQIHAWHNPEPATTSVEWIWPASPADTAHVVQLVVGDFHPENAQLFRRTLRKGFKMIKQLAKDFPVKLVLDLRGNPGGHIAALAELLPYLSSEPVRIPYGAQVRVSQAAKEQLVIRNRKMRANPGNYATNLKRMDDVLRSAPVDTLVFVPFEVPISPNQRIGFSGPVALIMDGLTASASVSIASWFIRTGRGATFGEPPMGSISGTFGNPVRMTLPESGLEVTIASARYFTQNPVRWESSPLLPNFPINDYIELRFDARDLQLDAAIRWLQEQ